MSGLLTVLPGLGIWADAYAQFMGWPTHPSIYQKFLLKPINLTNFVLKIRQGAKFCSSTHLSTKIYTFKPIHLPKFHNFRGKCPTHLTVSAFKNPSAVTQATLILPNGHTLSAWVMKWIRNCKLKWTHWTLIKWHVIWKTQKVHQKRNFG